MKFKPCIVFFILISILCISNFIYGQNQFTSDLYTTDFGLPSNHIEACTMDSTGYLWVATKRGICRYDGYNFEQIPTLSGNVLSLYNDNNKSLFFYNNTSGLNKFNPYTNQLTNILKTNFKDQDPNNDHFNNVFTDDAGRIWTCDFNHIKYFKPGLKRIQNYLLSKHASYTDKLATFTQFKKGEIWIAGAYGLQKWTEKDNKLQQTKNTLLQQLNYTAASNVGKDSLLLAAGNILFLIQPSTQNILATINTLNEDVIISMTKASVNAKKTLLIASRTKVYLLDQQFHPEKIFSIGQYNGNINQLFCSANQDFIWISTSQGLVKLTPSSNAIKNIRVTPIADFAGENSITNILKQPDAEGYFVSTLNGNCYFTDLKGHWDKLPITAWVNDISFNGNSLLLATNDGLFSYEKKKISHHQLASQHKQPVKKAFVTGTNIWLLLKNAPPIVLNKVDYTRSKNILISNNEVFNLDNVWNDICADNTGQIYIAGWVPTGFGLALYNTRQQKFVFIAKITANDKMFMGDYYTRISPSKRFHILSAGYGGFNAINAKGIVTHIMASDTYKMINDHLEGIVEMQDGKIWFGTEEGVQAWNPGTNQLHLISTQNGLPSNHAIYGFNVLDSNTIAIGLNKTISLLNTSLIFKKILQNKLTLSSMQINGKTTAIKPGQIMLKPGQRNLQFNFSALNFCDVKKLQYQYSINNSTWQSLGHNPTLTFSNFRPGNYLIKVRVSDNLDNWQKKQLELYIKALPYFYETIWFIILLIMSLAIIIWLLFSFRLQRLKEVNKFRRSISQDLHDDMGATLSSINILSTMLAEQTKLPEKPALYLQRINADVQQLQHKLEEIIWSLKREENSLLQVFNKLVNYSNTILEAKNITFNHQISAAAEELYLSYQYNRMLYLMLKEAINNIAKHSNAKSALLFFNLHKKQLTITISDDGTGINKLHHGNGNGITGMYKRAEALKAQIEINSAAENGTEIIITMKL